MVDASRGRSFVFLGLVLLGACSREASPRLALRAVESHLLFGDSPLELSGDALPAGEAVRVSLRGTMHAPGVGDRSVELALPGTVLSSESLVASGDPSLARSLGHGSFTGSVEVLCSDPGSPCEGSIERAAFDVDGPSALSFERLRRAALGLLATLSFEIADDAPRSHGLLVARVKAGGLAARAGLRAGDVIEASNGVRIHALADLAPAPSAGSAQLRVRSPSGERRVVRLPLSAANPFLDAHMVGSYLLGCSILLLVLWLSALPTPADWLASAVAIFGMQRAARSGSALSVMSPCVLGAVAGLPFLPLDVFAILLGHLAVLLAVCARRASRWPAVLGHLAVIWSAAIATAAVSGTRAWPALLAGQGALPWEWNLFARPPLLLAAVLCVVHAARLPAAFGAEPSAPFARVLLVVSRSLLAVAFAALFLGGSNVGSSAGREWIALGCVASGAKSWLAFELLGLPLELSRRTNNALLYASAALCAFWLWLAPSRPFELALGGGVCTFVVLALAVALVERRFASSSLHTRTAQAG